MLRNRGLVNLCEKVHDRESFIRFVHALERDHRDEINEEAIEPVDRFGRGPNGWENHTIEDFLEAATAWAKASPALVPPEPSWKAFALFLLMGAQYD